MAHAFQPSVPIEQPAHIGSAALLALPTYSPHQRQSLHFFIADLIFLVLVGLASTLTMHLVHQLEWPLLPTCVLGMFAAMLVQTMMAFAATPLLGSIESMVPSMVVAMLSPMTICALHLFGCESSCALAATVGIAFIRSAQAVGFTLDDIRIVSQLNERDSNSCKSGVQRLLKQRLVEVDTKMKERRRVRDALGHALDRCRRSSG